MTRKAEDPFLDRVLERLDHVEDGPRLDRDARRAIMALALVVLVVGGMVWWRAEPVGSESLESDVDAGVTPAAVEGALRRIQIPPAGGERTPTRIPGATPAGSDRYEEIDATAPGRRT